MNALKGQNLPIMNAVAVSLTLHILGGWLFLNIARDITNLHVVPPIDFFVVPPPPEQVTPAAPRAVPKPAQKNAALSRSTQVLPPVAPARPEPAAPANPMKQNVAVTPPPSPVQPIAASPRAKEPSAFHSVPASAAVAAAPVASITPAASRSTVDGASETAAIIGPSYGAAYLHNPSPPYPPVARRLKLQGTSVVRVFVSPEGQPKNVELDKTSGVRVLDDAAVEAVKRWSFVPARRGSIRIAAWVNVPIRFHLE